MKLKNQYLLGATFLAVTAWVQVFAANNKIGENYQKQLTAKIDETHTVSVSPQISNTATLLTIENKGRDGSIQLLAMNRGTYNDGLSTEFGSPYLTQNYKKIFDTACNLMASYKEPGRQWWMTSEQQALLDATGPAVQATLKRECSL